MAFGGRAHSWLDIPFKVPNSWRRVFERVLVTGGGVGSPLENKRGFIGWWRCHFVCMCEGWVENKQVSFYRVPPSNSTGVI
jgi:hypothetical protein